MTPQCCFSSCDFWGSQDWAEGVAICCTFGPYLLACVLIFFYQSFTLLALPLSTLIFGLFLLSFLSSELGQIVQHSSSFYSSPLCVPTQRFWAPEVLPVPPTIGWSCTRTVILSSLSNPCIVSFPFPPPCFVLHDIPTAVLSWRRTLADGAAQESTAQNDPSVSWHLLRGKEITQEPE